MPLLAVAVAGCSNSDSVTTSELAFVESYVVSADDIEIEVWVSVGCMGTRIRVFVAETADQVRLFAVRNNPDCGSPNGDVGYFSPTVVTLERALGDRNVVDAGCDFVSGTTPCAPVRSRTPSDT